MKVVKDLFKTNLRCTINAESFNEAKKLFFEKLEKEYGKIEYKDASVYSKFDRPTISQFYYVENTKDIILYNAIIYKRYNNKIIDNMYEFFYIIIPRTTPELNEVIITQNSRFYDVKVM